jgi:hypothetical protein
MSKRRRRLWSARVNIESAIGYLRQEADDEASIIAMLLGQVDRLHEMARDGASESEPAAAPPQGDPTP